MTEEAPKPVDAEELDRAIEHYRKAGKGQLGTRTLDQHKAVSVWLEQLRSYREGRGGRLPSYHNLKCQTHHFCDVARGVKRAELREDDRHFKVGDVLRLEEWRNEPPNGGALTGRFLEVRVTHLLTGFAFPEGLKPGYVMLSISPPESYGGTFTKEELPP